MSADLIKIAVDDRRRSSYTTTSVTHQEMSFAKIVAAVLERTYSTELRGKWVELDRLVPAFVKVASGAPQFSGQRLDAWQLS